MVPKLFVLSKKFWFLHFHRMPCELEHVRVLYKIKRKFAFLSVNTKYISSRELKTSEFSLVLRTRENSNVFNSLDEIYLVFTEKKSKYPLYICLSKGHIKEGQRFYKSFKNMAIPS